MFPCSEHGIEFDKDWLPRRPERYFIRVTGQIVGYILAIEPVAFRLRPAAFSCNASRIDDRDAIALGEQVHAQPLAKDAGGFHGNPVVSMAMTVDLR